MKTSFRICAFPALLAAAFTACGGIPIPPTVTPEEIARGWQLCEVRTNESASYAMPEGAVLASNWWVRGAFDDVKRLDFDGFRFPFCTNTCSYLWAFSWGKVRFRLGNANEIVAVGAPMSAVPYRSRLWTHETNNAFLVTWENFALGRLKRGEAGGPSGPEVPLPRAVNAQVELRPNGDFITRSNGVERVCRRVDPEDWDGDGWHNGDDGDPRAWDDFRGTFAQELPEGANTNAYCWILKVGKPDHDRLADSR